MAGAEAVQGLSGEGALIFRHVGADVSKASTFSIRNRILRLTRFTQTEAGLVTEPQAKGIPSWLQNIPQKCHTWANFSRRQSPRWWPRSTGCKPKAARKSFVAAMLANTNFALAKRVGQPAGNHRHHPLVVPDVRFVHAWHGAMSDFVGNDSEKVGLECLRVEVEDTSAEICHAFAKFVAGRPLNNHRPPLAVEFEAKRRTPFLTL